MTTSSHSNSYKTLVQPVKPPAQPPARRPEAELDSLIQGLSEPTPPSTTGGPEKRDSIQMLREMTINVFIPVFVELVEKYSSAGVSMQMDASSFLEGGREIKFEFGLKDYRTQLHGTVTTEAIAFHETRHRPDVQGELVSGPMLRLRGLDGDVFRDFVCERLAILIRSVMRRH